MISTSCVLRVEALTLADRLRRNRMMRPAQCGITKAVEVAKGRLQERKRIMEQRKGSQQWMLQKVLFEAYDTKKRSTSSL